MFSVPYLKSTVKSDYKFLIIFTAILAVYLTVMINFFTPQTISDLESLSHGTVMSNVLEGNGTLIGFMANSFYPLMAIILPMVYSIILGNRMIASKVDRGSMACFLSTPTTRTQIVITGACYFILSIAFMWVFVSAVGVIAANIFQPDELDVKTFLTMNLGVFLYHLAISGICFCASCIFNSSKYSLIFGGGIPLFFFVVNLFVKLSDNLDFLKYFTLNTLFDTEKILDGSGYTGHFIILVVIAVACYTLGIVWFKNKDLPI